MRYAHHSVIRDAAMDDVTRVLDAHVHVWDPRVLDYPWLAAVTELDGPFLPSDLEDAAAPAVFVQAGARPEQALAEVRWVASLRPRWPGLRAIVADADLRSPDLGPHLDDLSRVAEVAGIRHLLQDEPVERFSDPALARGLGELAERGLTFDACIRHPQLPALVALLERVPGLRVVLDHLGKPPVADGIDSAAGRAWSAALERFAALPLTHVKLSGLPAEVADAATLDRGGDAFLRRAVETFGTGRCMLGSDRPVSSRLGAGEGFEAWAQRVRRAVGPDLEGWASVAHATGEAFYRIAPED